LGKKEFRFKKQLKKRQLGAHIEIKKDNIKKNGYQQL